MSSARGQWSSRLGFILAAAGSAIGVGAIWKFPYMAGANGGGAFLLVYLIAVVCFGLVMMLAELALGRASQSDAVGAFRKLGGGAWTFFGYWGLLAAFLILSFYCVIGGWTIAYIIKSMSGLLAESNRDNFDAVFFEFIGDRGASLGHTLAFLLVTIGVIVGGVKEGIERVSKVLMPVLFLIMLVMIGRTLTLDGAMKGVEFFLVPEISKITPSVVLNALGFACFSLSLGFGAMLTYGSYVSREESLGKAAMWVVALQTLCVLMAGMIVLPAVFAFGMEPTAGPGLTYITLPAVFQAMPGGTIFATLFFILLLIAALTSSVSLAEPLVAYFIDQLGWGRKAACLVITIATGIACIPSCWSFGVQELRVTVSLLDTVVEKGEPVQRILAFMNKTPFDILDFITSNFMLPTSVIAVLLIMGWRANDTFIKQLKSGLPESSPWPGRVNFLTRYVAPVVIFCVLIAGFIQ